MRHARFRAVPLVSALALAAGTVAPATAQWHGRMGAEMRAFAASADRAGRTDPSLAAAVERAVGLGTTEIRVKLSLRFDPTDTDRSRLDADELAWYTSSGDWDVSVGVREVSWGVLESRRPVDVINQRDPDAHWLRPEPLGQPMIAAAWLRPWGTVELYLLPWARPRPFTGRNGRLWSPRPVDARSPGDAPPSPWRHLAVAGRWSVTRGDWDLGVSYFRGTARDPRFDPATDDLGTDVLRPAYDRVNRLGLDVQYTGSSWLWKAEAAASDPRPGRYVTGGAGVEYAPADYLSFFGEALFDSRGRDATTSLERDVFVGARALHQDGSASLGAAVDVVSGNLIGFLEVTHRLGAHLSGSAGLRVFAGRASREPPVAAREGTTVSLRLHRFF